MLKFLLGRMAVDIYIPESIKKKLHFRQIVIYIQVGINIFVSCHEKNKRRCRKNTPRYFSFGA